MEQLRWFTDGEENLRSKINNKEKMGVSQEKHGRRMWTVRKALNRRRIGKDPDKERKSPDRYMEEKDAVFSSSVILHRK